MVFVKNFSKSRCTIYLHGVPRLMSNPQCSFDVSSSGTSGNELTSRSDMENIMYNCTLTYGKCESFGSLFSICIHVYGRSYFPVLPIKYLINKDSKTTTTFKIVTDTKSSVSYLRFLFCLCVVQRSTAHVGTKALNMLHQVQKGFCGIFIWIPQHQKGYLLYVPHR